jgi:hypothetical protein
VTGKFHALSWFSRLGPHYHGDMGSRLKKNLPLEVNVYVLHGDTLIAWAGMPAQNNIALLNRPASFWPEETRRSCTDGTGELEP